MNALQIFNNPEFGEIRAVEIDGEPWLVGKDVAKALGYVNPRKALEDHVDSEDKTKGDGVTIRDSIGREQHPTVINESGVYSLIFSSKLPGAKSFKRWVTSEVLPSIRKTGAYLSPERETTQEALPAVMDLLGELEARLTALEQRAAAPPRLLAAPVGMDFEETMLGLSLGAKKRWMRTVSEKLNLLSARFNLSHNEILHRLYKILEEQNDISLEEEKMQAMEEHDLPECSVLTAIFYNEDLRISLQGTMDFNLAPENRGW